MTGWLAGRDGVPGPASAPAPAPASCDVAIVGGGIVGLALAREISRREPRLLVAVLERERELACHQSAQSSGVVHAGIYYAPGSLKARLCVEGADALYRYCEQHGIAHRRCGKLIVASERAQLAGLDELMRRGRANGVQGLRRLDAGEIAAVEPYAVGVAALHSPCTGIVDFPAVARSLAGEVAAGGGTIATGCEVRAAREQRGGRVAIEHGGGVTRARWALFCAGAWSDRLAVACGAAADPRIVPFRGAYLRLTGDRRELVRALIYPVADRRLPFLGVHLTRTIDGEVLIGPTALIALSRDGYGRPRARALAADVRDTAAWPGTWRMMRRWWRTGLAELRNGIDRGALLRAAARYVPELRDGDVEPAFAGVRAQALRRDGRLEDDFVFSVTGRRMLHVRNAPSPAATSCLAIAAHVADTAQRELGLGAA